MRTRMRPAQAVDFNPTGTGGDFGRNAEWSVTTASRARWRLQDDADSLRTTWWAQATPLAPTGTTDNREYAATYGQLCVKVGRRMKGSGASFGTKCCASAATQPIMIGWARRIMIRLEGPAHARVPTCNNCAYSAPIMIGWARRIMIRLEGPAYARVPIWNNRRVFREAL